MSKENQKLLVEALRSGLYNQGYGRLKRDGFHCCLGVACELYQKQVGDLEIYTTHHGDCVFDGQHAILPEKIRVWLNYAAPLGFVKITDELIDIIGVSLWNSPAVRYIHGNDKTTLAFLNDRGVPFDIIATIIEKGLVIERENS